MIATLSPRKRCAAWMCLAVLSPFAEPSEAVAQLPQRATPPYVLANRTPGDGAARGGAVGYPPAAASSRSSGSGERGKQFGELKPLRRDDLLKLRIHSWGSEPPFAMRCVDGGYYRDIRGLTPVSLTAAWRPAPTPVGDMVDRHKHLLKPAAVLKLVGDEPAEAPSAAESKISPPTLQDYTSSGAGVGRGRK